MVALAEERHGAATGVPLILAHGLFGSARNWRGIGKALGRTRPVIAVDMRNHGASPFLPEQGYAEMAGDLADSIAGAGVPGGAAADLLGHSMGGKAAMALALTRPELVRRLIVADIAPVAYTHSHARYVAAMQAVDPAALTSRAEAEAALARHVAEPLVRAFLLTSLVIGPEGNRWALNLDVLGAEMARLTGWPGFPGRFTGPTLFLHGSASPYVLPEHRAAILSQFPGAEFVALDGAGHWLHAEKPREFIAAVDAFLSR